MHQEVVLPRKKKAAADPGNLFPARRLCSVNYNVKGIVQLVFELHPSHLAKYEQAGNYAKLIAR